MERNSRPTPQSRDVAMRRLRGLTAGVAGMAAGAVAIFGFVSAATLPGKSAATAATTTRVTSTTVSATPTPTTTTTQQSSGSTSSTTSGGAPHAVSGGS